MSKELYKKYRPRSLKRVVGNKATVVALQTMLEEGEVPHTILFAGPSGCGKTTLARIMAKELGCGPMDFNEQNSASIRGIDTVRDIMRQMSLAPSGGSCRVWLLDEVHQMSKDGQHAMLKMLEDTPSHVYFMLATTDPQKLLPTIRNRATFMPVEHPAPTDMGILLKRVTKKEKIRISNDVADELVHMTSPRAMLVTLDKIRHLDDKEQLAALRLPDEDDKETIDLCRALIKKQKWSVIAKILKGLKADPESVRHAVLGYARAVLLNSGSGQAFNVICAFEDHFYDSKEAGLARACFEAVSG